VLEHPDLRPAFMDIYDEDGIRTLTEDVTFIRRARDAGFRAWVAMEYRCSHYKEVDLLVIDLLYRRLINRMTDDA
jgi:GT2 family glycosyltransferase